LKDLTCDFSDAGLQIPWYLVQLRPNGLGIALRNLARQGFDLFCPMHPSMTKRRGQFHKSWRPLFPGYLFVGFDQARAPWRAINSTYGVSRLVNFGTEAPRPVPEGLITGLRMRCDADGRLLPPETLEKGDSVRILSGPFAEFVTTVERVTPDQRIWVLLDLLGRPTRVMLARDVVQKV